MSLIERNGICQECKGYLSVGPIIIAAHQLICGRCVKKYPNIPGLRDENYEQQAQLTTFPCRYDVNGCLAQFKWNMALPHETICDFGKLWCPAIGCDERLRKLDLEQHITLFHKDLILSSSNFEVPWCKYEKIDKVNTFLKESNKLFILKLRFLNNFAYVNISCLSECNNLFCIFKILSDRDSCSGVCYQKIKLYNEKYDLDDDTFERDLYQKIQIVNSTFGIVIIVENEYPDLQSFVNILETDFECSTCSTYIKPPFRSCKNGHINCPDCILPQCYNCQETPGICRNITLDKVMENVFKFSQKQAIAHSISVHEISSSISDYFYDEQRAQTNSNIENNRTDHLSYVCAFNNLLLKELQCPVCFEKVRPPFISCNNGHIICCICFQNLRKRECSFCQGNFECMRNDILDNLAGKLFYLCEYSDSGCLFVGRLSKLLIHESNCHKIRRQTQICYLKEKTSCNWFGLFSDLATHLRIDHVDYYVHSGKPIKILVCELQNRLLYTEFDGEIFRIIIDYGRTTGFKCHIKLCSRLANCIEYKFSLQFLGQSEPYQIFVDNDEVFDYNLKILSSAIRSYINGNMVQFVFNCSKV